MADDPSTDIEATVARLLEKKGADNAVGELLRDNRKQRDEIRDLKKDLQEVQKKVPGEGAVVLSADDAKKWTAYQALGKPEELEAAKKKVGELEGEIAKRDRETGAKAAAEAAGFKPDVLLKLPGAEALKFEVKTEKVDGEDVKVAYVTGPEQGATPKKLTEHAEAAWSDFLPSLQAEEAGARGQEATTATSFPRQSARGASPSRKKSADDFAKATEATIGPGGYTL